MEKISFSEQLKRAISVFEASLKSKFYREKYKNVKKIESYEDWSSIPILTQQEVHNNSIPNSRAMLTVPLTDMILISTGGSSGVARYTAFTHQEWEKFADVQSEALKILGVKSDDVVANLFIAGHLWPSFLGIHDTMKRLKAVHLPISANIPPEEIVKLCLDFEPTVMISLSTLFVFIADLAVKEKFEFKNLRMILYGGEHMSEQAKNYVMKHLKVEEIKSLGYSSADAGLMGYQCDYCEPGEYHIPTGFQFIEIFDFEKNRQAEKNELGEIITTNLSRTSNPIIRYRVRDLAMWLDKNCKCGDANPLIKFGGRAGDDFKIGGGFISFDEIEKSIAKFSDYISPNFQLVLEDEDNKLKININIESGNKVGDDIKKMLKEDLFSNIKEFAVGTEKEYIKEFNINILDLGTLPRSPITGKIKRLVDNRINK